MVVRMHLKHWLEGSVYQMRSGSNIFSYLCNVTRQLAWLLLFSVCAMKNILVSNKHTIYLLHSPSSTQLLSRPTIAPIRTPSDPPSALDHLWTFATHYTLVFCLHLTWHAMGTYRQWLETKWLGLWRCRGEEYQWWLVIGSDADPGENRWRPETALSVNDFFKIPSGICYAFKGCSCVPSHMHSEHRPISPSMSSSLLTIRFSNLNITKAKWTVVYVIYPGAHWINKYNL